MSVGGGEDPVKVRRVRRVSSLHGLVGLVLLGGGSLVVLLVPEQPVQRVVFGVVAVPVFVYVVVMIVRDVARERREGTTPPSREAARRMPAVAASTVLFAWGFGFVLYQVVDPVSAVDSALLKPLPLTVLSLGNQYELWRLRREMKRERQASS